MEFALEYGSAVAIAIREAASSTLLVGRVVGWIIRLNRDRKYFDYFLRSDSSFDPMRTAMRPAFGNSGCAAGVT